MTVNTQNLNAKSVAKYVLLPGIIPRAKALATGGFGYLAYLFACVYRTVRILPPNHPYVNPSNIGKFGIVKVVAAAANNIQFNRKNLDQVVVFVALLGAVALMVLQFLLLVLTLLSGQAFAGAPTTGYESIFLTQYPELDIAFLMLDHVFGIPAPGGTFFGSNALGTDGPTPFHQGLHALFNFYNLALLLVGVLIFLYYVLVVVMETAQTGVPFGRRFSKIYAPLRLVIAIGMLVPLNYGFNAAQYITLYAAKLGSSFATNGWLTYNNAVRSNPMGVENSTLIAKPRAPAIDELAYFASVYHSCRTMYDIYARRVYLTGTGAVPPQGVCIRPYVIVDGNARQFASSPSQSCNNAGGAGMMDYIQAKVLFNGSDMEVVLGELDPDKHAAFAGGVRPYCGRMTLSLSNNNPAGWRLGGYIAGVQRIEQAYYNATRDLLAGTPNAFRALGERAAYTHVPSILENHCHMNNILGDDDTCNADWTPGADVFSEPLSTLRTTTEEQLRFAYGEMGNGVDLRLPEDIARRGWGGAGIWYNQIADVNGTFTSATYATPSVKNYPEIMEKVKKARQVQNKTNDLCKIFSPNLGDNIEVSFDADKDRDMALAMNGAYEYFACDKKNQEMTPSTADVTPAGGLETLSRIRRCGGVNPNTIASEAIGMGGTTRGQTENPFINMIGLIFGINGLFDIRNASCIAEATGQPAVHPLAQLSTVGRSLVENAIRSMGMALGASFGGGILSALGSSFGAAANSFSGMLVSIATLGLTAGFVLYYILPFLPFMYFFFAVGAWVKSIFEAMVGAPLWALAHLHIDGDGLPGRAAMTGYFLVFEIFLRPITIVLGLIGGMAVFGIMATVLNNIFDLVVLNTTGAIPGESTAAVNQGMLDTFRRGVIDQLFFTIMYAIILYMIATASFKMIDTIPASVMRWIGSGVPTFNDNKGDPTQGLTQYAAIGGSQITGQVFGGMRQGASGAGQGIGAFLKEMGGTGEGGAGGRGGAS